MNKIGQWGLSSLNGILVLIFGLVALFFPSLTVVLLAMYFAIAILLGGIILTFYSLKFKESIQGWGYLLTEGIIGISLGVVILIMPESAAALLVIIVGLWAIFIGIVFFLSYYRDKLNERLKSFHLISGIISASLGLVMILNPFEGTRLIMILVGIYAVAYGVLSIVNSKKRMI